ncbi:MAG: hypothetical protein HYY17_04225 [Planctomycetes bacterium]|nr:hypothetical protein [Planctomycetota bacterium]
MSLLLSCLLAAVGSDDDENFPTTWRMEKGLRVADRRALAPDVHRMDDGTYRMYYTVTGEGVGSAKSADGLDWTVEKGYRIRGLRHSASYVRGAIGFDLGHPWLVRLPDKRWRMYLQASTGIDTPLRIVSAISRDGFDFEMEPGIRIDIGASSGPPAISFAGHGRAWRQGDGSWTMVFSGNLWRDMHPSDIMLATSRDGLAWKIVDTCLYDDGHDPTVLRLTDGRLAIVFAHLRDSLQVGFSIDGLKWSAARKIEIFGTDGKAIEEIHGDVALMRRPDAGLRLMSNDPRGIASFIP